MTRSRPALRFVLSTLWVLGLPTMAAAQDGKEGKVLCDVTENGQAATGTLTVLSGETEVASGPCGKPLAVAAGEYTAMVELDGALDGPKQRQPLSIQAGKLAALKAEFSTGLLEVRIKSQGRDTAGMAIIRKDGAQIGTLGSGVAAHLSAGRYEVVARYRSQQKAFAEVIITAAQRTVLDAAFE
jgi:hypothetical protein